MLILFNIFKQIAILGIGLMVFKFNLLIYSSVN